MPPPQHPLLSILIPVLLALSAVGAQGATLKEDEVVSDLATRFRWRDPYNWQPVLERDIAVPALPDGHKKFQFYIQDENGQLVQEWFTLQEIQDLLIRFGPIFRHEGEAAHPSTDSPEDSIHQVIASVQQVISEEVAQTQRLPVSLLPSRPSSSPPSDSLLSQAVEESIDIPDGILQNLKNHPYFMTSWVTLPTTRPEETTTNPWLPEGEEHSEDVEEVIEALEVNQGVTEAATATLPEVFDVQGEAVTENAITDMASNEFIVTEDASAADVTADSVDLNAISDSGETKSDSQTVAPTGVEDTTVSGMPGRGSESTVADYETTTPPATQRPLFDRWNSRYPAWTAFPARDTPTTVAIPSYDLEPVDDYNSSPVGLSGVEKPADEEVKVEFGFTTWNYPGEHDEAMDGMSTTTEHENLREDSTTMQPENGSQERPAQDILMAAENENSQPRSTTPVDTMDATTINGVTITPTDQSLVNKIVVSMNTMESDFEQTTRTVPSEVEKEPSVSVTTPSPTTIAPEKPQGTTSPSEIPIDNLHVEMDSTTEYYPWSAEDNDPYFPLMSDPLLSDGAMTLMDLFKHQGDTSNYFGEAPHYDFPVFEDKPSQSSEDLTSDKEGTAASMEEQDSTTEFSIIQDLTTNAAQDATLQETPGVDLPGQDIPNQHSSMENLEILDQNIQSLITDSPSTQSPETQSPSTEGPQGEYPTTKDVSSQSLASKASTSLPPTTNPVVEGMTTQSPAVQELTSQNPSSPETTELPLDTQTTTSQAPLLDPVTTPVPISPASVSQEPELPETNKGAAEPTATTPEPSENPAEEALPTTRVVLPTLPTTDRPTSTEESKQPAIRPSYDYYYDTFGSSNILPPAPSSNEERIDLGALERTGGQTDDYYYDDYYPSAVYLDNVSEDYYDYTTNATQPVAALNDTDLDFPGPNATSPYHDHHHGEHHGEHHHGSHHHPQSQSGPPAKLLEAPPNNPGLEASVEGLDPDVRKFVDVMNDVAFKVYKRAARQYKRKNFVMSPLSLISTLSMLLLGARGTSSAALSDLLLTDQFYTFNPHLILKNVTQVLLENDGAHDVVFLNQFLVEKPKNPYSLDFFARTIKYFYDASVSQVEPSDFDSHVRDRVNEMVRNVTLGAVGDFLLQDEPLYLTPPLSAVSTNFFHGRWNHPVTQDDLFDMDFLQFPTAERRLVRTVGLSKKMTINAGYSSAADVTTAEIPFYSRLGELSLILVMPGKQKDFVANGLAQLEASLSPVKWSQILRSMLPNTVQFQMPVFRHRAFHNFSDILQDVGLGELFQADKADFSGINNVKGLRLSDVVQLTEFQSCQIEEPLKDGATSSRRVRRKAQGADFDETGPTAYYRKTYIYGLPMFEYMRREEEEEEEEEQDLDTEYAAAESFQTAKSSQSPFVASLRTEAPSASPDLTSSKAQWSNADGDDLSGLQAESLLRQDLLDYYGPLLSAPDENRVNRMGIPHARKPAGGGTYYRQDDAGTLAFDRAFLYVVRHNPTGLLLFMGRYLDPAAN
ncbi:mucin-17-like [Penaeus japonicus]|uniref:mucin-17-like n=1 Tax=Penaeus japonicus TaxID=27405 RepID=UPI001C710D9B|nr:mucin-17-like [Penaeus japonicus]